MKKKQREAINLESEKRMSSIRLSGLLMYTILLIEWYLFSSYKIFGNWFFLVAAVAAVADLFEISYAVFLRQKQKNEKIISFLLRPTRILNSCILILMLVLLAYAYFRP